MIDDDLVAHIAATTGLSRGEAARVVDDVLAFYSESTEEYVRRRHAQLQLYGTRNADAFRIIRDELTTRAVKAPQLSERQLRRMIYG